jgi:hypothetical protein
MSFTMYLSCSHQRCDCRCEVIPSRGLSSENHTIDDQKLVVAVRASGAKWDAGEPEHV